MPVVSVKNFTPTEDKYHQHQVPHIFELLTSQLSVYPKNERLKRIDSLLKSGIKSQLYTKLDGVDGVWGALLHLVYRFVDYKEMLDLNHPEFTKVQSILDLLQKLWIDPRGFNQDDGENLLGTLRTWLSSEVFEGDPSLALDVLSAIYFAGHYMVVAHPQTPFYVRGRIQSLVDGFKAITFSQQAEDEATPQIPSLTEQSFTKILASHPALLEEASVNITPHNASFLILNELSTLENSLRKRISQERLRYEDTRQQLACLSESLTFLEQHETDFTPAVFWGHYDNEADLMKVMHALCLSEKESQSWLASYRSYHAQGRVDGFLKGASYYWSGVSIDIKTLKRKLLDACHIYHERVTQNPSVQTNIRREIKHLSEHMDEEPFMYLIRDVSQQIDTLKKLAQHLDFNPAITHKQYPLKKKVMLPLLQKPKVTDPMMQHLVTTREELRYAERELEAQKDQLQVWLRTLDAFDKGLNFPLFEAMRIDISPIDSLYRALIKSMHNEIIPSSIQNPQPINLTDQLTQLHEYHERVISKLSSQISYLNAKISLLEKTSSDLFLPVVVTYFANLEDDFLQRFSLTFTALYSKVFSTLEGLSAQASATPSHFYRNLNIALSSREASLLWRGDKTRVAALLSESNFMMFGEGSLRQMDKDESTRSSSPYSPTSH